MTTITIDELFEKSKQSNTTDIILDVRSPEEFSEGHVPNSKNIPYDEVQHHIDELKKFTQIYIYCKAGSRAEYAAHVLEHLGIQQVSFVSKGGMPDWARNGYPTA